MRNLTASEAMRTVLVSISLLSVAFYAYDLEEPVYPPNLREQETPEEAEAGVRLFEEKAIRAYEEFEGHRIRTLELHSFTADGQWGVEVNFDHSSHWLRQMGGP
jgi:hypothetical protein